MMPSSTPTPIFRGYCIFVVVAFRFHIFFASFVFSSAFEYTLCCLFVRYGTIETRRIN